MFFIDQNYVYSTTGVCTMYPKIILAFTTLLVAGHAWAPPPTQTVPEPSTLALFASVALAVLVAKRFKK